jgi:DNA-binding transcriptional LysR family regulator
MHDGSGGWAGRQITGAVVAVAGVPLLPNISTAKQRCHPERSRRISPTCVASSALVRSLDCARDDIAIRSGGSSSCSEAETKLIQRQSFRIQFEIDFHVVVPAGTNSARQRIYLSHVLANFRHRFVN